MRATLWGTRGSLPTPDPETVRLGGNTSCVEVRGADGTVVVLDAGTGIRRLGGRLAGAVGRVDILLTHLHMDHIQGLGFFAPIFQPGLEVHIWGPPSSTQSVAERLARYLSPPLFPVHLREVPSRLRVHDVTGDDIAIGPFHIDVAFVCHPNPTVGYRIVEQGAVLTYLPDHEPALGSGAIGHDTAWVSGYHLAEGADLLVHDAQYSEAEYPHRVGWGHSSMQHTLDFAELAGVGTLVPFHHDPSHSDEEVERMIDDALQVAKPPFPVIPAQEGMTFVVDDGRVEGVPASLPSA